MVLLGWLCLCVIVLKADFGASVCSLSVAGCISPMIVFSTSLLVLIGFGCLGCSGDGNCSGVYVIFLRVAISKNQFIIGVVFPLGNPSVPGSFLKLCLYLPVHCRCLLPLWFVVVSLLSCITFLSDMFLQLRFAYSVFTFFFHLTFLYSLLLFFL